MKREQFKITSNAGHSVVKYKWNSAIRETERLALEAARSERTTFTLTSSTSIKGDFGHVSGHREWLRPDGSSLFFYIAKQ